MINCRSLFSDRLELITCFYGKMFNVQPLLTFAIQSNFQGCGTHRVYLQLAWVNMFVWLVARSEIALAKFFLSCSRPDEWWLVWTEGNWSSHSHFSERASLDMERSWRKWSPSSNLYFEQFSLVVIFHLLLTYMNLKSWS